MKHLDTLQRIFQGYFDNGLYEGIANTKNRVSTGVLTSNFSTPHINIAYQNRRRRRYATSGMDEITTTYQISFLIKPAPSFFLNGNPKINEITKLLNGLSIDFLDKFIKEQKDNDEWYLVSTNTETELKQYDLGTFFINATLTIIDHDN